jgi:hypothetical protein
MSAFKLQLTYSKAFVFSDRIRPYTDADYTHRFRRTSQELGKAILHAFPPLVLEQRRTGNVRGALASVPARSPDQRGAPVKFAQVFGIIDTQRR